MPRVLLDEFSAANSKAGNVINISSRSGVVPHVPRSRELSADPLVTDQAAAATAGDAGARLAIWPRPPSAPPRSGASIRSAARPGETLPRPRLVSAGVSARPGSRFRAQCNQAPFMYEMKGALRNMKGALPNSASRAPPANNGVAGRPLAFEAMQCASGSRFPSARPFGPASTRPRQGRAGRAGIPVAAASQGPGVRGSNPRCGTWMR